MAVAGSRVPPAPMTAAQWEELQAQSAPVAEKPLLHRLASGESPLAAVWKSFVKPLRDEYTVADLGPKNFEIPKSGLMGQRQDVTLTSSRGFPLECSHWRRVVKDRNGMLTAASPKDDLMCIVYLHGMGSSRCEAWAILEAALDEGMSVFSLDFAGSGLSGGEYVSLGHHEQEDVKTAIDYLRSSGRASAVALWGRSMGAATAIFRAGEDPSLAACVLDSPFSDFGELAYEIVNSFFKVPKVMVRMMLQLMRKEVWAEAGFDVMELVPLKSAAHADVPAWFCTGDADDFIGPHHSDLLYEAWAGSDKHMTKFPRQHHRSTRPRKFRTDAVKFLHSHMKRVVAADNLPMKVAMPAAGQAEAVDADAFFEQSLRRQLRRKGAANLAGPGQEAHDCGGETVEDTLRRSFRDASRIYADKGRQAETEDGQHHSTKSLEEQLLGLGISQASAAKAVARCSSIEAAVEWLATNNLM
mmetsp:Transcript_20058/g.36243  ORF Transcript_20058/g.36243 Transcript_20058/m.36243 type:complete len:470 (+) Transcript_20058:96-1505(+)